MAHTVSRSKVGRGVWVRVQRIDADGSYLLDGQPIKRSVLPANLADLLDDADVPASTSVKVGSAPRKRATTKRTK